MKRNKLNIKTYWCDQCGHVSINQEGEEIEIINKLRSNKLCPQCKMTLWEYYIDMSPEINYLQYNIENCEMAFDKLKEINEKLRAAMDLDSPENPLGLGHYNRIIQDYLIIKVAGLFDKDTRTISFYNLFDNASEIEKIEKEDIIRYIEEKRPRFCAHYDRDYIKSDENKFPNTQKIVNSNLKEILKRLQIILDGLKNKLQITNHKKLCQKF